MGAPADPTRRQAGRPTTGSQPQVSLYPHLGPPHGRRPDFPQAPGAVLEADLPPDPAPYPTQTPDPACREEKHTDKGSSQQVLSKARPHLLVLRLGGRRHQQGNTGQLK